MPRRFIKKHLPSRKRIQSLKLHYYFGNRINDPKLWLINRQSVSRATAIGLFCAYLPMPMEMLLAAMLAILLRANLPIAVVLVWVSNPFTWLILYTPPYLLGLAITGEATISLNTITMQMMFQQLTALWIGCLIFGSASAVAGYTLCNVIWRMVIVNKWTSRKKKLATAEQDNQE